MANEKLNFSVLWVGGPPAGTYAVLRGKLDAIGCVIFDRWYDIKIRNKINIPTQVNLVMINQDMIDPADAAHVKHLSELLKIPWIYSSNNFTSILETLKANGILPSDADLQVYQELASRNLKPHQMTTTPVTEAAFEDEIRGLLVKAFKISTGEFDIEALRRLTKFIKPELDSQQVRIKDLLPAVVQDEFRDEAFIAKMLSTLQPGQHFNVSTWGRNRNVSYGPACKEMFALVYLGLLERVEPYSSEAVVKGQKSVSFYFRLTPAGVDRWMAAQSATPEPPKAPPLTAETAAAASLIPLPLPSTPPPAPVEPPRPTVPVVRAAPVEPVPPPPPKKVEAKANLSTVVQMIRECLRSEHPDIQAITISVDSSKVEIRRVVKDEFDISE